jgi:hypothetical protein
LKDAAVFRTIRQLNQKNAANVPDLCGTYLWSAGSIILMQQSVSSAKGVCDARENAQRSVL